MPASAPLWSQTFDARSGTTLRRPLLAQVMAAGLDGDAAAGFVVAVHELVINAVLHGGGSGRVRLDRHGDVLVCEVRDHGSTGDPDRLTVHRPDTGEPGGRGLWLAHRLTDGLTLTALADGVSATVTICLVPEPDDARVGEPPVAEAG